MPLYFFNLVGPDRTVVDRDGAEFASLEEAHGDVHKAIVHISLAILEDGGRPELMAFEIVDQARCTLARMSFADVLRGMRQNSVPASRWFDREVLRDTLTRSLRLQRHVEAEIMRAHRLVEDLRTSGRLSS